MGYASNSEDSFGTKAWAYGTEVVCHTGNYAQIAYLERLIVKRCELRSSFSIDTYRAKFPRDYNVYFQDKPSSYRALNFRPATSEETNMTTAATRPCFVQQIEENVEEKEKKVIFIGDPIHFTTKDMAEDYVKTKIREGLVHNTSRKYAMYPFANVAKAKEAPIVFE